MTKIVPAILPQRFSEVESAVAQVVGAVDTVQIDFVDGVFAPNKTLGCNGKDEALLQAIRDEKQGLPHWEDIDYEFDLMVQEPIEKLEGFLALGPSKIILHVESLDEERVLKYFEALPEITKSTILFGIALNIDTDPTRLQPYAAYIDTIQCMGIDRVGFQGQPFDGRVIEQLRKVKARFLDKHISVDGGVSLETAPALIDAGVDALIVGSAIFEASDPRNALQQFKQL
ncbi:MAG TPA: hypothetical protein VG621_02940 [Candidatus Paceibacterota bacterium]|nr:hypothetical protein [Candidatus Paceibacterota bacterium]